MTTYTDRVRGLTSGVAYKAPVLAATTDPISLSGLQTVDGVALSISDRVLVKDQADGTDNGIWLASTGDWMRAIDCNGPRDLVSGSQVFVQSGDENGNAVFHLDTSGDVVIGTTDLVWSRFGSTTPGSDTIAADMPHLLALLEAGQVARLDPANTYTFSASWEIPDGAMILGAAPITYTGSEDGTYLTIGDGVTIESFALTSEGDNSNGPNVVVGDNFTCGEFKIRTTSGDASDGGATVCNFSPVGLRMGYFESIGHARPIVVQALDQSYRDAAGARIGHIYCTDTIRAVRFTNTENWSVDRIFATGAHPLATNGNGENTLLIDGCAHFHIGDIEGIDTSEHVVRIAGDVGTLQPIDFHFGRVRGIRAGRSVFKINADQIAEHWTVGVIHGTYNHDGASEIPGGSNTALARLSHVQDGQIGQILGDREEQLQFCGHTALTLNDANRIYIGEMDVLNPYNRMVTIDDTLDTGSGLGAGDVNDIIIGRIGGTINAGTADEAIRINMATEGIGSFSIGCDFNLAAGMDLIDCNAGVVTNGPGRRLVHGVVRDTAPGVGANVPNDNTWIADLCFEQRRYFGRMAFLDFDRGSLILESPSFNATDLQTNYCGPYVGSRQVTSGAGVYGGAVIWGRPGSGRRGAAMAIRQHSANVNETALEMFIGAGATATDALNLVFAFRYNGVLNINDAGGEFRVNGTKVVGAQQAAIANSAGGDEQAKINAILAALRAHGLIAT